MSRPGLYIMMFFRLLHSCAANDQSSDALKILKKQFPDAAQSK